MCIIYRNVVYLVYLLVLGLDTSTGADACQGHFFTIYNPYLDAYICAAIDSSVPKNSHIEQLSSTQSRNLIFKLHFPSEKINPLSEYNGGKFYELFILL